MGTVYLNNEGTAINSYPSDGINYGIKHFDSQGNPAKEETQYSPMQTPQWNTERLENQQRTPFEYFPAPSIDGFIEMTEVLRKFVVSNGADKNFILCQQLGFLDTGTAVGGDKQFIYRFNTESTQIEIYISESGVVTELNRFNQSNFEETRIPLNLPGFNYIFMQVYGNLNHWNFNKIDAEMVMQTSPKTRELITADVVDYIDPIPVEKFLLSRAAGRISRGELGYNYPN